MKKRLFLLLVLSVVCVLIWWTVFKLKYNIASMKKDLDEIHKEISKIEKLATLKTP